MISVSRAPWGSDQTCAPRTGEGLGGASPAEIEDGAQGCEWVVATAASGLLAPLQAHGWSSIRPAEEPITDDYPDVLRFARFGTWLSSP